MDTTTDAIRQSPVDFEYAVAYALHPEMRRLIILYVVGTLLVPTGLSWFLASPFFGFLGSLFGLLVAIIGAVFLFGGLVGTLFKLVTDANVLALEQTENQ